MVTLQAEKLSSYQWLRHKTDRLFHAYPSGRSGAKSSCGGVQPIHDLREMDIPGQRSGCCGDCFTHLYGINLKDTNKDAR